MPGPSGSPSSAEKRPMPECKRHETFPAAMDERGDRHQFRASHPLRASVTAGALITAAKSGERTADRIFPATAATLEGVGMT